MVCSVLPKMLICNLTQNVALRWSIYGSFSVVVFVLTSGVNYDYLDVPSINLDRSKDWSLKNGKFRLGDDAREGKNMIATKIIESPLTEIHGWWMPNVKWTAEINCKTGLSHICRKVTYMACVGQCRVV